MHCIPNRSQALAWWPRYTTDVTYKHSHVPLFAVCLTVFPLEIRPTCRIFTIRFYEKIYPFIVYDFGVQLISQVKFSRATSRTISFTNFIMQFLTSIIPCCRVHSTIIIECLATKTVLDIDGASTAFKYKIRCHFFGWFHSYEDKAKKSIHDVCMSQMDWQLLHALSNSNKHHTVSLAWEFTYCWTDKINSSKALFASSLFRWHNSSA